jgi:hypothetical protein
MLAQMGLTYRISGEGPVVEEQDPAPGSEVSPGSVCRLVLGEVKE